LAIVDFRAHVIKLKAVLKAARAHGVPLHEEDDLVELLADFQVDEEIPDTLTVPLPRLSRFYMY